MRINLDVVLSSPDYAAFLFHLEKLAKQAQGQNLPFTILSIRLESVKTDGEPLEEKVGARLQARQKKVIVSTLAQDASRPGSQAANLDEVFMIGGFYFLTLYNANPTTYLGSVRRILEALRLEAQTAADAAEIKYRYRAFVGAASWSPPSPPVPTELLMGKLIEASLLAASHSIPSPQRHFMLPPFPLEELFVNEYMWDRASIPQAEPAGVKEEASRKSIKKGFKR